MPSKTIIVIPEILEMIFSYLHYPVFYPKFLLSCALVSRSWSNYALSFLWSKPFVYGRGENIENIHDKQIQQFRIFLLFLPNQLLKQVGLEKYSNSRRNFDHEYLSFIKELYYLKLYEACLEFWEDEIDDKITDCASNHPSKYFLQNKILPLISEIYNQIVLNYEAKINYFEFSVPRKTCFCDYIPENYFTHLRSAPQSYEHFSALQSFKCNGRYNYPYEKLFKELMKHSKNIKKIKLENFEILEGNLEPMKKLIGSQKRLRSIELEFLIKQDFSDLFDALTDNRNLQRISIFYCSFNKILPIKILSSCNNLKELSIESSEIGYEQESHDEINPFTTLKSLQIVKIKIPPDIFNRIFSKNSNLEQIIIKGMDLRNNYSNIIPLICLNCHQLKILLIGLTENTFEKILEILEKCKNLQELTVYDEHYIFSSNTIIDHLSVGQVFRRMGKLISHNLKKLKKLHFTSFYHFSEDEFEEFLFNCKINGTLRCLSINISGDQVKIMRLLKNYTKEINMNLIIKQWDTRNYDGKKVKFHQIFTIEFN